MSGAMVLCALLAGCASFPGTAATRSTPIAGGYQRVDRDRQDVQEAREAIQKNLALLRVGEVQEAWVQVVAGMNYRLTCRVTAGGEDSTWEFIIWHRLGGRWELRSARQI